MLPFRRIDHLALSVSDLKKAETFYRDIVGLDRLCQSDDGVIWLGGRNGRISLGLYPSGPDREMGLKHFAYEIQEGVDLEKLVTELESQGVSVVQSPQEGPRPGGKSFAVSDPDGNKVFILIPTDDMKDQLPLPGPPSNREIAPIRLGHVVIKVADTKSSEDFYRRLLGLKVTEYNEIGLVFLRCTPEHHDLGLVPASLQGLSPGLHHFAMDIGNTPDMARVERFLKKKGVRIEKGPGYWNQGHHIELYFLDPDRNAIELYVNMNQYHEDIPPETTASFYTTVHFGEVEVRREFQTFKDKVPG